MDTKKHFLICGTAFATLSLQGCDLDLFGMTSTSSSDDGLYATADRYNDLLSVTADLDRDIISFDRFTTRRLNRTEHEPLENVTLDQYDDAVRAFFDPNDNYKLSDASGQASNAEHVADFNTAFGQFLDTSRIWKLARKNNRLLNAASFNTDQPDQAAATMLSLDWTIVVPQFGDSIRQHFDSDYKIIDVVQFNNALGTRLSIDQYLRYALSHINNQLVQNVFNIDILADAELRFSLPKSGLNLALDQSEVKVAQHAEVIGEDGDSGLLKEVKDGEVTLTSAEEANAVAWEELGDETLPDTALGAVKAAQGANRSTSILLAAAHGTIAAASDANTATDSRLDIFNTRYSEITDDFDSRLGIDDTVAGGIQNNAKTLTEHVGTESWKANWSNNRNQLQRTIIDVVMATENGPEFISESNTATSVIESHEDLLNPSNPCISCLFGNVPDFLTDIYQNSIATTIGTTEYPVQGTYDFMVGPETITAAIYDIAYQVSQLDFANVSDLTAFLQKDRFPAEEGGLYYYVIKRFQEFTRKTEVFLPLESFIDVKNPYYQSEGSLFNFLTNKYFSGLTILIDFTVLSDFVNKSEFPVIPNLSIFLSDFGSLTTYTETSAKVGPATPTQQNQNQPSLFDMIGVGNWPSDYLSSAQRSVSAAIIELATKANENSSNVGPDGIAKNVTENASVAKAIGAAFQNTSSELYTATAQQYVTKSVIESVTSQWSAYVPNLKLYDPVAASRTYATPIYVLHGVLKVVDDNSGEQTLHVKVPVMPLECNSAQDHANGIASLVWLNKLYTNPNGDSGCLFTLAPRVTEIDGYPTNQWKAFDIYGGPDRDFFGDRDTWPNVAFADSSGGLFSFYVPFSRMVDHAVTFRGFNSLFDGGQNQGQPGDENKNPDL